MTTPQHMQLGRCKAKSKCPGDFDHVQLHCFAFDLEWIMESTLMLACLPVQVAVDI